MSQEGGTTRRMFIAAGTAAAATAVFAPTNVFANARLALLARTGPPSKDILDDILRAVAYRHRVSTADILSADRSRRVTRARQLAMYIAHKISGRSMPEIGRRFGCRDHTTVLYAVRKIESRLGIGFEHSLGTQITIWDCVAEIELNNHAPPPIPKNSYALWRGAADDKSLAELMAWRAQC